MAVGKSIIHRGLLVAGVIISGNFVTAVQNVFRKRAGAPRVLFRRPLPNVSLSSNWSARRINALATGIRAQRYLEVGVEFGNTADKVRVHDRVGVDPAPRFDTEKLPKGLSFFAVESDSYFASIAPEETFDLVLLDGLHSFAQTKADLFNALQHVPSGAILIDDTVPSDGIAALPDHNESLAQRVAQRAAGLDVPHALWMGDVWKLVIYIGLYLPQLNFRTIVGSGNVQTLIWRRQPGEVISDVSRDMQLPLAYASYEEVFKDGIPVQFKVDSETDSIRACLADVAPALH